ncbi:hypothetical protein DM02DRAFT_36237 [Periconia macrospinosa]|uniref:Uncharacterized protein n=1 Tax=Periconia macrospinosa TaxID=97972 RepID=A0A2V1E7N5_9PLEO|nr:hypothetical protein DM02DRAFT_36237 [Periconia macrospinosa]
MKSLVSTALLSASILSSNALYIPDDRVWHIEGKKAPHTLHALQARADFRQGSCQMGQIMDPDLDQAKDELWPVCITKEILPCPAGQYPTHATLHMKSVCLADPTETNLNGTFPSNGTTGGGSGLNKDGRKFRSPSNKKMFYFRTAKVGNSDPSAGSTPGPSTRLNQVWELQVDERTTPTTRGEMRQMKFEITKDLEEQKKQDREKIQQVKLRYVIR